MRSVRALSAVALAVLMTACATAPPASATRPAAPVYHAPFSATSCVAGAQDIAPSATITFTPPTTNVDGTPVAGPLTFNLYQSTSPGAEVKTTTGLTGSPVAVNTGVVGGTTYYWELTAVDAHGVESARSNEACKTFPVAPPNAFVITIQ